MTDKKPLLVLVRGIPGSGKSYIARALRLALGEDAAVILDPDATDYDSPAYRELSAGLTAQGVDEKFHPYRFLRSLAYRAIEESKTVVWNQAFTNLDGFQKTVANLQSYAADHGTELPLLVVEVTIDAETARRRVAERAGRGGHDVVPEAFERFLRDYASFADQGYRIVAVDGADNVGRSVEAVIAEIRQLESDRR